MEHMQKKFLEMVHGVSAKKCIAFGEVQLTIPMESFVEMKELQ